MHGPAGCRWGNPCVVHMEGHSNSAGTHRGRGGTQGPWGWGRRVRGGLKSCQGGSGPVSLSKACSCWPNLAWFQTTQGSCYLSVAGSPTDPVSAAFPATWPAPGSASATQSGAAWVAPGREMRFKQSLLVLPTIAPSLRVWALPCLTERGTRRLALLFGGKARGGGGDGN